MQYCEMTLHLLKWGFKKNKSLCSHRVQRCLSALGRGAETMRWLVLRKQVPVNIMYRVTVTNSNT